ncbi:MAG: DNA-binding response regulator [Marinilabiliales bacterium]|nr:MAG: DNA-binding response regulator [Marinilabiliales bacterium]
MTQINFKIIFVTASDTYALKAFKYSALDYIVKPVDPEELADAINRAAQSARIDNLELQMKILIDNLLHENKEPDKLVLKTSEAIHVVKTDQIVRCEADRNYTMFFMDNGEKILISNTLKEYEKILPDRSFIRVHNSHLVNIEKIKKYEKLTSGCLIMSDNSLVPVSVRKKDTLMHLLGKI